MPLVLTRKANEQIVIGDNIVITLLGYRRGAARIAVDAPKDVSVNRKEVQDRINAQEAAGQGG